MASREIRDVTRIWASDSSVYIETNRKNILSFAHNNPTQPRAVDGNPSLIRTGRSAVIQFGRNRWQQTRNYKDQHGEWAALAKLGGSHWPFGFVHDGSISATASYLLWLSAD